ncbi:MAG TPA: alpha-amylase family protein [Spirochaetia bacterium]|nr:alpha-amylase family protein [Spirochaetia bacterium]
MEQPWYRKAWRRAVLDMHIPDDDERFLTRYDGRQWAELVARSGAASAVVYAMGHVGLALYPSNVIPPHKGLGGRDLFAEGVDGCHERGIAVSAYLSVIFDTWAYRHNPGWKMIGVDGLAVAEQSRYGTCCPNSPYRDYIAAFTRELCERYSFEGIRFDMTFWPHVCYCPHCRARFQNEVGGALPTRVNWEDPTWVAFQRKREQWLAELAELLTRTARQAKPGVSVEHQASTYPLNWKFGVSERLVPANDFLQGDFYGDAPSGSIARKLFSNMSPQRPAAFETSIATNLANYTAMKPLELVRTKAHAALADATAFVFIDSVDPLGTLNPAVYHRMARVFQETRVYEPYLGGQRVEDVVVYLGLTSKCDLADNGKRVDDPTLSTRMPHVESVAAVASVLFAHHVPFGIITRRNLAELSRWRTIVVPNAILMDDEEAAAIREFVRAGGNLYASRFTSLIGIDGRRRPDFLLADVFGSHYGGETAERFTYMAPTRDGEGLFGDWTAEHPMGIGTRQITVRAEADVTILATLTLPFTNPDDPIHFASIHNNPPGVALKSPSLLEHRFGKGRAIWAAGDIELAEGAEGVTFRLLSRLAEPFTVQTDAPRVVEITTFWQEDRARFLLSMVNFPKELPAVPVLGTQVALHIGARRPRRVLVLPEEKPLPFQVADGFVRFGAPRLDTFLMIAVDCETGERVP